MRMVFVSSMLSGLPVTTDPKNATLHLWLFTVGCTTGFFLTTETCQT